MDLARLFDLCLHSLWLLPVLAVMIAADGPVPVLPSETILMSAAAAAFGVGDVRGIVGLFGAALAGSIAGDLLVFALGRSSPSSAPGCCPAGAWSARPRPAAWACRSAGSCRGRSRAPRCGASTCWSSACCWARWSVATRS